MRARREREKENERVREWCSRATSLWEGKDREENKIESKARGWERGTRREPACRVAFHQSQMLFSQFSCSRAALESRRLPSADYSLLRTALKCFGRSSKLVPSCFSLYSSFFFPAFVPPSPTDPSLSPRPPANPPNRSPSFVSLCSSSFSLTLLSFVLSFLLGCFHIDK